MMIKGKFTEFKIREFYLYYGLGDLLCKVHYMA